MCACYCGHDETALYLCERNPTALRIKNSLGQTCSDFSSQALNPAIAAACTASSLQTERKNTFENLLSSKTPYLKDDSKHSEAAKEKAEFVVPLDTPYKSRYTTYTMIHFVLFQYNLTTMHLELLAQKCSRYAMYHTFCNMCSRVRSVGLRKNHIGPFCPRCWLNSSW